VVETRRDYVAEAVQAVDGFGRTPLHVAAQNGRTEIVRFLVEQAAADVHATLRQPFLRHGHGETPLVPAQPNLSPSFASHSAFTA
jgi:ankyrin repeat protein